MRFLSSLAIASAVFLSGVAALFTNARGDAAVASAPITADGDNHWHAYAGIALDPRNTQHLVAADIDVIRQPFAQYCAAYDSTDAGRSWTRTPIIVPGELGSDTSIAVASDGVVYDACLGVAATSATTFRSTGAYVAMSTDGGRTFGTTVAAALTTDSAEIDKPYLAIDTGTDSRAGALYVCYTSFDTQRIPTVHLAHSDDRGQTWQSVPVSSDVGHECSVAVGPDGSVYVAYERFDPMTATTNPTPVAEVIAHSTDGGATFGPPAQVGPMTSSQGVVDYFGSVAVDESSANRGAIYAAYESGVGNVGHTVLFSRSLNDGASWSTPQRVADSSPSVPTFMPWIAVAPNGRVDVVYADQRNTGSFGFDAYLTSSNDGGAVFGPSARLSPSSAAWDGVRLDPGWPGDYFGLASTNAHTYAVWNAAIPPAATAQLFMSDVSVGETATPTGRPSTTSTSTPTTTPVPSTVATLTPTATATRTPIPMSTPTPTTTPKPKPSPTRITSCPRGYYLAHGRCIKLPPHTKLFTVQGQSMLPTLKNGKRVLVNTKAYAKRSPKRGDLILFKYPHNPAQKFVKRVIGLPGNTIAVKHRAVYVNGHALKEAYIEAKPTYTYARHRIPKGDFFVLGDNRNNSFDSHNWGPLPRKDIIGKVVAKI